MPNKTFNTYRKTETLAIDLQDPDDKVTTFRLKSSIPGAILLDFISGADAEDPAAMARTVNSLLDAAIAEEDTEAWKAYIRDPKNEVGLDTLSEIAGYVSEVLSGGNDPAVPSSNGS